MSPPDVHECLSVGCAPELRRVASVCGRELPMPPGTGAGALTPFTPKEGRDGSLRATVFAHCGLPLRAFQAVLCASMFCLCGCRKEMWVQPKYKPLDMSEFFSDTMSARALPQGTVALGEYHTNESFYTGLVGTNLVQQFPLPITAALLRRGQERYDIYCAVCHGSDGDGDGIIVQRGFPRPPSYHIERLRRAPIGHFFRVITEGYGVMYPYATRVAPDDRWKIAAYIRALQLSRHATLQDAPPKAREELTEMRP